MSKSTHILHRHAAHRKFSTDCGLNSLKQKGFHSVQLDQRTKSNQKHSQAFKKHVCLRKNFSLCLVSLNKLRREPVVASSFAGTCRHCVAVSYLFFQDYLLILFEELHNLTEYLFTSALIGWYVECSPCELCGTVENRLEAPTVDWPWILKVSGTF